MENNTEVEKRFDKDVRNYENSFYSHECGCEGQQRFAYSRNVANGEVWNCREHNNEIMTPEEPNPDNSKYFIEHPKQPQREAERGCPFDEEAFNPDTKEANKRYDSDLVKEVEDCRGVDAYETPSESRIIQVIKAVPQQPQVQYDLQRQLTELRIVANKLGMYDAADFLSKPK